MSNSNDNGSMTLPVALNIPISDRAIPTGSTAAPDVPSAMVGARLAALLLRIRAGLETGIRCPAAISTPIVPATAGTVGEIDNVCPGERNAVAAAA